MKPLSEQTWREKIQDIFNDCTSGWLITIKDFNGEDRSLESLENEIIDDILTLTTQDRKAWGEYVIGGNIPFLQLNDGSSRKKQDVYASGQKHMMNRLLAAQRQRNQGEKK